MVALPVLLVGGCVFYQVRHVSVDVGLAPEYGYPAEPGDTLVIARRQVLLPGVFGNQYVNVPRWVADWRLVPGEGNAAADIDANGTLHLRTGGHVAWQYAVRFPFKERGKSGGSFDVVASPLDTIVAMPRVDSTAAGDTIAFEFAVRSAAGIRMTVNRPMFVASDRVLWFNAVEGRDTLLLVRGRTLCDGRDSLAVWIGHHRTLVRYFVAPRSKPVSLNDPVRWDAKGERGNDCSTRNSWHATLATPWSTFGRLINGARRSRGSDP